MAGRGGARSTSGPPPDPNALRRDRDKRDWLTLPGAREGDPPAWPLVPRATVREKRVWAEEWRRPQAVMWEANGQQREVALYVRYLVAAEEPDASNQTRTLVRQLMDDLGISLPGLRRANWIIATEQKPHTTRTSDPNRDETKAKLRAITGGAA